MTHVPSQQAQSEQPEKVPASEQAPAPVVALPRVRPEVRVFVEADRFAATCALCRAFEDDPLMNYLVRQDGNRAQAAAALFSFLFDSYLPYGISYITEDCRAACIWQPPSNRSMPLRKQLALVQIAPSACGWRRAFRALRALAKAEKERPAEPHYYLAAVGVDPSHQGRGYGSAVLRPVLDRADAEGMPCYLESSNPKNNALYEHLGFKGVKDVNLGGPAPPPILAMWREPKKAAQA